MCRRPSQAGEEVVSIPLSGKGVRSERGQSRYRRRGDTIASPIKINYLVVEEYALG